MRRRQKYKKYVKVQKKLINYFRTPIPPIPPIPLSLPIPLSPPSLPNLSPKKKNSKYTYPIQTLYEQYRNTEQLPNNYRTITEV